MAMRRRMTCAEAERLAASLEPALDCDGLIGYAAARNARVLGMECIEFSNRRDALVRELGTEELDADGRRTGRFTLPFGTPEFDEFERRIEEWALAEVEPEIYTVPPEKAVGKLTGRQILALDWMFEEGGDA